MSDDGKTVSDLPSKGQKPPKGADENAPASVPVKDADAVKGGGKPLPPGIRTNHNQTILAHRSLES